jgi:hypothetical protein
MRVLVTEKLSDAGLEQLREHMEVDVKLGLGPGEVSEIIADYDAVVIRSGTQITADLVVPAANVPASPEAEQMLVDRGVTVVPDFVANGGAAAWAWWTLFGDVEPTGTLPVTIPTADFGAFIADNDMETPLLSGTTPSGAAVGIIPAGCGDQACYSATFLVDDDTVTVDLTVTLL